jgi:transposase
VIDAVCRAPGDRWEAYSGIMRYPDGGGLSARARDKREAVRMRAAAWFAEGVTPPEVARRLRVSNNSAYMWRRRWRCGGTDALASMGPAGSRCRLSSAQVDRLRAALDAGPAVYGWVDQRWTLARVATLIGRLFHVRYTLRGASYLLHRIGFSPQMPARRAVERDEKAIAAWRTETWAKVRG